MTLNDLVNVIRPHQYVKNVFILMPLFFAGSIVDLQPLVDTLKAFAAFSLVASAVYVLNDYRDKEEDRYHPRKRSRPLVTGAISTSNALVLMSLLATTGMVLMATVDLTACAVLCGYTALNLGYIFYLRHIAILDVTVIAIGFVLRLFVGASVSMVPLSMWIVIMTFLLALFLALAKRRDDVLIFLDTGNRMRKVVDGYNLKMIEGSMMIMASVVIVAYILYTTSAQVLERMNTDRLYMTALFVILGIMRYLQIVFVDNNSGSPTLVILRDRFMQVTIAAWLLSFAWIIYL